ncbi:cytochrome P450 [Hanstruepera flava]|uniref:cytochrome P450 n=1 Tax=Hanstruepera flava TaxID=2930218 RepID=UPI0020285274|nr:cytochrome P450 [Hanstruepera flava]
MDELDLLKKDWKKAEDDFPKLSYNDIYKMILKKSSSIVKWIFIISLLEFGLWLLVSFALKDNKNMERFQTYDADWIFIPLSIIGYVVLAYFFYLFYRNYRNISVTDNAKILMENILKTRRSVKHYVAFNLIYLAVSVVLVLFIQFDQDEQFIAQIQQASADGELVKYYVIVILTTMVFLAIAIGVLLLFYWLVYGILLGRLNKNYKELKKLEL